MSPQTIPGYHVWEAPGKAVSVQMNMDTLDRLSNAVLTGFGAIPRRGAEVGGILVGSLSGSVVRIDEFEAVPCSYKRGPSYLLSDSDAAAFAEAFEKWKPAPGKDQYAVGFYRSNTRDKDTLSDEDRELAQKYFPPPSNVMLFIRPHATKVSTAGFVTWHDGRLDDKPAVEFPFRRYELEGGAPPARRPLGERAPRHDPPPPPARFEAPDPAAATRYEGPLFGHQTAPEPERAYAVTSDARARRKGWVWIPLSFIFLLLGVLLGFQAALTIYPRQGAASAADPYALNLSVTANDDNLHVKWDREAGAIRAARRGVLHIQDSKYTKQVDLDAPLLQTGSVIYRKQSGEVRFRLEVFATERAAVTETVDWKAP